MRVVTVLRLIVIIFYSLSLLGCSNKSADEVLTPTVNIGNGAFIPNLTSGSITYVPRATGNLLPNVYQTVNNRALGEPVHMARQGERIYIALQDQNRLEVVNARTFRSEVSITGLNTPVFILPISDTKLYVAETNANLGAGLAGTIAVVNLSSNTVNTTRIAAGGPSPRKLVRIGSNVYVQYATTPTSPNLTVVNTNTDAGTPLNLALPRAVDAIADAQGFLWVALRGDLPGGSTLRDAGTVVRVNVTTVAIERTLPLVQEQTSPNPPLQTYIQPVSLATNTDGSMLFFTGLTDGTNLPWMYSYNLAASSLYPTRRANPTSPSNALMFDASTGTPLLYSVRSALQNPTSATGFLVRYNASTLATVDSFGVQIQPVQVFF